MRSFAILSHDLLNQQITSKASLMAERKPTGGVKVPSSGNTTPEYNAVLKAYDEINSSITAIPHEFESRAHSCGLIPSHSLSKPTLDVVLDEISRDPVNYYTLQQIGDTLNVGNRFDKGIGRMEATFRSKDNECEKLTLFHSS